MIKLVIEMDNGIVTGVFSNYPIKFDIKITDSEDEYDVDRMEDRKRLKALIDQEDFQDVLNY